MSAPVRIRPAFRAYLALTKPRVIELLLVTTVPAMLLAYRWTVVSSGGSSGPALPDPWLMLATLVGGSMAAASANTLNCVVDADIDAVMKRTRARPLVRHQVPVRSALVFGLSLGVLSFGWLLLTTNALAAVLAVATIAFYVLVYTIVLKRRTAQNIVWGGAAGCMPVVIGWAAVTGSVGWPALIMFGVIFFWTPPHFWSLAMRFRDDYAAAGGWFLLMAHGLHRAVRRGEAARPMRLFHLSNSYLTALFVAIAVDAVLGLGPLF